MLTAFADGSIVGERYGDGEVDVVALHGWQRTHADFAPSLSVGTTGAIAVDLPGFGATPPPEEPWGSPEYAATLVPVLASLGRPVVCVGHSFGGRVALQLALLEPDLVRGLVLTGVPQLSPRVASGRPNRTFQAIKLANRLGLASANRLEAARLRYGSRDYREAEGVLRGVLVLALAERYAPLLPRVGCPVELLWGALDTAAPVDGAVYADGELAHSNLVVLEGVGHMVPAEAPEALRLAIERATA